MGIGAALVGGGLIGAAGSYMAADKQAGAVESAQDAEYAMFLQQKKLQEPFREAGYEALPNLTRLSEGGDQSTVEMMGPEQRSIYNALDESVDDPMTGITEDLNRQFAARGISKSSAAMDRMAEVLSEERRNRLGQQYNMITGARQDQYNRLAQLANIGQGATAQTVRAAGQYGQSAAQSQRQQGQIYGNAIRNISAMPMKGLNTYMLGKNAGVF